MRRWIAVCFAVGCVASPASAEDADSLRRELRELRRQLDTMKDTYQKAIDTLTDRLERLETVPPPATAAPAPAAPAPPVALQPPPSTPSLTDVARRREPFALAPQRGAGNLLFDIGIAGDFVGSLTQRNIERAGAGTFAGRENRFFPREVELNLFGQVDPYARGEMKIEAGEEERGGEIGVGLAEANVTLLTLPYGTQAKFGLMRNRFGYSNILHEHDMPWIDRPNVMRNFLGEEGLAEKGVELTLVPPLPFYVEALAGVFNGDNETAFGRGSLRDPLVTARLRTFFDLTDAQGLQLGVSGARGQTPDRRRSSLLGAEARYKYRPDGWLWPLLTLTGEYVYSWRKETVGIDADEDGNPDFDSKRARERAGWYAGVEVQPIRRWAAGVRYDWSQFPIQPGREAAVEPYITFFPSEFLRFRLGYKHTDRTHRDGFAMNNASGRTVDEILFQGTFILGAHPAHPF